MRISFSGAASTGKSTLYKKALERWPMFGHPTKTYRDIIKEDGLDHSSMTNEETQLKILDWMMKTQEAAPEGSKVFYDRCTLDNLVYTLQANARGQISDEVTGAVISLVRESMRNLDIIFWIPFNDEIKIEDDGMRDTDLEYIKETDSIFSQMYDHYSNDIEDDVFFPKDDCPAIIPIEMLGIDDRLWFVGEFIDQSGNLIEADGNILSEENIELMQNMMSDQLSAQAADDSIINLMNSLKGK